MYSINILFLVVIFCFHKSPKMIRLMINSNTLLSQSLTVSIGINDAARIKVFLRLSNLLWDIRQVMCCNSGHKL